MGWMFQYMVAFTQPLVWDTSKATTMQDTFSSTTAFNSSRLDTSQVTIMQSTFYQAQAFDQLLAWDDEQGEEHGVHVQPRRCLQPARHLRVDARRCRP